MASPAWAFAKLERKAKVLMNDILQKKTLPHLQEFNGQELVNTAWAFVKLDFQEENES